MPNLSSEALASNGIPTAEDTHIYRLYLRPMREGAPRVRHGDIVAEHARPMSNHDALAQSLAAHLRSDHRMTWCDLQLGPSGSVRPDVYAIYKSYVRPCPTAYEVKVSAADFRGDITAGKWQSYLKYAAGVYFACDGDLIKPSQLPEHCGLIVYRNAWRVTKKAVLSPVHIPQDAMLKLLIDGVEREGPQVRARHFSQSLAQEKIRQKFGDVVAATVQDRLKMEYEIESAERTAKRIIEDAQRRADRIRKEADVSGPRSELCEVLGLPLDADVWRIKSAVSKLRRPLEEHPANEKLRLLTESVRRALDHNGYKAETTESEID